MPTDSPIIPFPEGPVPPALLTLGLIRQHYVPVGERTLRRWMSSGLFPRADIAMGGKVRFWKKTTVEKWISDREKNDI